MKTSVALLLVAALAAVAASREDLEGPLARQGRAPLPLLWLLRNRVGTGAGTASASAAGAACPPPGFNSVAPFDLARYIARPWYTQAQIPTTFQPVDTLYCVRAEYKPLNPANPLGGVSVRNYANRGAVNGPATGTSGSGGMGSFPGRFIASVPDPQDQSKLSVGFALGAATTPLIGAPYWVVAIDPDYSWAIITGGAPGEATAAGGCVTQGGFWLFTRDPVVPQATVDAMKAKAEDLGLDSSLLVTVPQAGCKYEGA